MWTTCDGAQVSNAVATVELRSGKAWRESQDYAEPYEAPERRAWWVERMDA